jgi:hypothetical protein
MEQDAARAGLAFSASLDDASQVGMETVAQVGAAVRPVLVGVGVLAFAILTVRLLRDPPRTRQLGSSNPPRYVGLAALARSAGIAVVSVAGRWLVQHCLDSLKREARRSARHAPSVGTRRASQ